MPQKEVIPGERRQLEGILQQARAGGETRACEALHARIAVCDRVIDAIKVQAITFSQQIELVRDGEVQVSPAIGKQLGKLRFQWRQFDQVIIDDTEEVAGALERLRFECGDDLRQGSNFFHGFAFRDSLWTEGHVYLRSQALHAVVNQLGDTRVDGAAENQQSSGRKLVND